MSIRARIGRFLHAIASQMAPAAPASADRVARVRVEEVARAAADVLEDHEARLEQLELSPADPVTPIAALALKACAMFLAEQARREALLVDLARGPRFNAAPLCACGRIHCGT